MKTNRPLGWRKESPLDELTAELERKLPPESQQDLRIGRRFRKIFDGVLCLVMVLWFIGMAVGCILYWQAVLIFAVSTSLVIVIGWFLERRQWHRWERENPRPFRRDQPGGSS